jgi:Pentapeptide repeats (8 copies)
MGPLSRHAPRTSKARNIVFLAVAALAFLPAIVAISLTFAGIAFLALLALLAIWWIPKWQARQWAAKAIEGKDLAELENGARTTIVQILGGAALILTVFFTWVQIRDTRNTTNRTLRLNASQQETDRFTRAVQELGSSNFALRLGGIYSLEQLATATANDATALADERQPVVQLMVAYLHRNHAVRKGAGSGWFGQACVTKRWRARPDTQAAIDAILDLAALTPKLDLSTLDLTGLDLSAVRIDKRNLAGADLRGSSLIYAQAADTNLANSILYRANLHRACLRGANLHGAHFDGADTSQADLRDADRSDATGIPTG